MKKTVSVLAEILLWVWQFPQNITGWFLWVFIFKSHATTRHKGARIMFTYQMSGGVTLGKWVFLDARYYGNSYGSSVMKHEYGHTVQSKMLGWLYLIVIGLPSIVHAAFHKKGDYYHFYTEKWANRLADKYYD